MKANEVPKYDDLLAPTIQALKGLTGSASNEELHDWIADHLALPTAVRDHLQATAP